VHECDEKTVFVEIAVDADAMRLEANGMPVIAENGFAFTGDS
jgi:hypothetical protein